MSARGVFFLAGRYLRFHRAKTAILLAGVTVVVCLPVCVHRLVARFEASLAARARATPLVVGARGSRFDLVLHALHFRAAPPGTVPLAVAQRIRATGYAQPIPLHAAATARGFPLVGTTLEYFDFRALRLERGEGLVRLGDCVLGAAAARALGLAPGARLMTDPANVFDIAGAYPVNLRVTGILAPAGTPDDAAIFADLKTAWLVQGLAHGHEDVARGTNAAVVLARTATHVVANAALPPYVEVTDANRGAFHFHGDPDTFPATAILAVPSDLKSATLLRGRFQDARAAEQMLVPAAVVAELLGLVFRVKRFFDANLALVSAATVLFLALVVALSLRLRRREMEVLYMLGCSRGLMVRLQLAELACIGAAGVVLALAVAAAVVRLVPFGMGVV